LVDKLSKDPLISRREAEVLSAAISEQGFAIIPDVLAQAESTELVEDLARAKLPRSKAGIRHALGHSAIGALARDRRLLGIAREILGGEALPFRATLFDKSRDANWLVVWHQDTALPLRERRDTPGWGSWSLKAGIVYAHAPASALSQVLALRVHLDDCARQSGPLRVLPGTHRLGVLSDDEIRHLAQERSAVDCLAAKGGALAMRPLLVHSSSKTQVEIHRRVLHIEYAACTTFDGLELAVA